MKNFTIHVQGYYLDESRKNFPSASGIYFVYRGIHDKERKRAILNELIYIGETDNLFQRHNEHDRRQDFLNTLGEGEVLFYCYAKTNCTEKERKQMSIIESISSIYYCAIFIDVNKMDSIKSLKNGSFVLINGSYEFDNYKNNIAKQYYTSFMLKTNEVLNNLIIKTLELAIPQIDNLFLNSPITFSYKDCSLILFPLFNLTFIYIVTASYLVVNLIFSYCISHSKNNKRAPHSAKCSLNPYTYL